MNPSSKTVRLALPKPPRIFVGRLCHQSGFTIMELFVVIAIMAILSAVLLPALNKGRSRSQMISCMNNLRQLQVAWLMFPDDHDGVLPPNNYVNGFKRNKLIGDFGPSWCPGDTRTDVTTQNIQSGELYSYTRSTAIYHCPSDNSKITGFTQPQTSRTRSYSMSGSLGCSVRDTAYDMPSYLRSTELAPQSPSRIFVFIDAHEDAVVDAHFAMDPAEKVWIDLPADRHDRAGNLSFVDGHIERWKWRKPQKYSFTGWRSEIQDDEKPDAARLRAAMRHP